LKPTASFNGRSATRHWTHLAADSNYFAEPNVVFGSIGSPAIESLPKNLASGGCQPGSSVLCQLVRIRDVVQQPLNHWGKQFVALIGGSNCPL
jgi:hypothetical protein